MLGLFIRLFIAAMILAGVVLLFAVSFVAAILIAPIIFLLVYFFGRRAGLQVWTVRTGPAQRGGEASRQGPVIDHDPNDLPLDNSASERRDD